MERFVYVLEGELRVDVAEEVHTLKEEGFTYFPPELAHTCAPPPRMPSWPLTTRAPLCPQAHHR